MTLVDLREAVDEGAAHPTVVQRLGALLDDWQLTSSVDGVAVATGRIRGTEVAAFATDASVQGGALGEQSCRAIAEATDLAVDRGVPVVGIWQSGGARLREGVAGLDGVARTFAAQTRASGQVPQISVVLGPAAGGAAYGPALTDVIIMGPAGRVFVTGPDIIRRVTGEDVTAERLGGPETHTTRSGVAHLEAATDDEALYTARRLVSLLGDQGMVDPHAADGTDPTSLVPGEHRQSYDMRPVVRAVLDPGTVVELQPQWARNAVTALGRLGGRTVGVVANDPQTLAGCLDADTGDKTGRFVQWCDALGVPLVFLVDVPGYLPGLSQEDLGVVRRGAKLLHAYAAARVPRLTVVLRKAFGGAFIAMGSKGLGADHVFAWPGAQVDVMGATAAVEVLHRRELAAERDPRSRAALVLSLAAHHEATTGGLARALETGVVDAVIEPHETRRVLLRSLAALPERRGDRHANGPL
ncbi:MAG TPA: carboxyl transferase domain-containing protein [Mycobacteriales bacterium]|jgi:acetyl-CoA/propionyl-CoA carboxylase carboxyl transferase subunit|nr:carboxyl transferase domain-containing protein [Mycobacteriales bacterium]